MKNHILKTVDKNMKSHGGFVWPRSGPVQAPDWDPTPDCGGGLHGALNGEGDGFLFSWDPDAVWVVAELPEDGPVIDLDGKVKVPRCNVIFAGPRLEATDLIRELHPESRAVIGAFVTSGDRGTSTSGYHGTSTSGNRGTSTSGECGTSTSGNWGTSTSGEGGTSTSGAGGTSTSGECGTSTSGNHGTSTSGNHGTSTSGNGGTSTSGESGELRIRYWDGNRYRLKVGYVGENGIKPNVPYRLNDKHEFEEVV